MHERQKGCRGPCPHPEKKGDTSLLVPIGLVSPYLSAGSSVGCTPDSPRTLTGESNGYPKDSRWMIKKMVWGSL